VADEERTKDELVAELNELGRRISLLEGRPPQEWEHASPVDDAGQTGCGLPITAPGETNWSEGAPELTDPMVGTIDISRLVNQEPSHSGTFVLGRRIRPTTFGKIIQALPIPVFLVDDSLRISALNRACVKIGPDYEKLEQSPFADLFPDQGVKEKAQSLLELIFSDRKPRSWEAFFSGTSGVALCGRFSFRPVRITDKRYVLVIIEDITQEISRLHRNSVLRNQLERTVASRTAQLVESNKRLRDQIVKRQQIEAALRKSEERFRELAELLPEHVFELDEKGFFTFSNRVGMESLGYTGEEFKQPQHILRFMPECDHARALDDFRRLRRGQKMSGESYTLIRKDGSPIEVSTYVAPIVREGRVVGARGVAVDISRLKETQRELDRVNADLEKRIERRTEQLTALNKKLREEIAQRKAAQAELETEKGKLAAILEAMADGVHMVDQNYSIQFTNRALRRDFGEVAGRKCYEYFHNGAAPCPQCHFQRVAGGLPTRFEWSSPKNGKTYELRDTAIRNADGAVWKLQIFRDITHEKLVEKALRESERRYRELIENAPDIVFETDSEMRLTFINSSGRKAFGLTYEELIGASYLDFVHPEFRTQVEKVSNGHFAEGIAEAYLEYPILSPEGQTVWLGQRTRPIVHEGKVARIHAICRDITDRKVSEAALRESEEKYRQVVERASDGIAIVQEGKVKYANPALAKMLGYAYLEELDQPFSKYVHPSQRQRLLEMHARRMKGDGAPQTYDTALVGKNGDEVLAEVNSVVIDYMGKPATLIVLRDVDERRRMENQLADSELKFRSVVENAKEGITVIQDGVLKYVNPCALEMLGRNADETLLQPFLDFIHPEDVESAKNRLTKRLAGEELGDTFELRIVNKDGVAKWVEADSVTMAWEGENAILTFLRDVSERRKADQALKESEARFRALFENMIDAVAVYKAVDDGRDFLLTDMNRAAEQMERINRSEAVGNPVSRVFPGVRELGLFDVFQRVWRTGEMEHPPPALYKDARNEGWRDNVVYKLPTGEIVVVYSDETEKKKAEDSRRETENRYRAIVDNAQDLIFLKDVHFRYTHVNPAMERLLGVPRASVIGKTDASFFDAKSAREFQLTDEEVLRGGIVHYETTETLNGVTVTLDVLKAPITDVSGAVTGICGIGRDVTEKRSAEEQSRRSEEKYRALFNNSRDGVYFASRDGQIEEANPAFLEMLGVTSDEIHALNVYDLHDEPEQREAFRRELEEKGSVADFEAVLAGKDGRKIECLITSSARRDSTLGILGYEGGVRDVTDRKILERRLIQAQKMEAIGTLAAGIAHDFNNILYAIIGFTELSLDEAGADGPLRGFLERVLKAGERAKYLVNQILTFSRRTQIEKRPVLLGAIVKEVCKFLRASLPTTVEIKWRLADDLSPVLADPTQIHQVLMNLCANAGHAMRIDGGILDISVDESEIDSGVFVEDPDFHPGRYQIITVADTGHGMDRALLDRIFDPYFTTKPMGEGTGLGLAVVHGIVKAHKGMIKVESRPGEGSAFRVYLPVLRQEAPVVTQSSHELPKGKERLLVVDDEEPIAEMIGGMLRRLGYEVVTKNSGIEAFEAFKHAPTNFDLVLTDVTMPHMTGTELAKKIREIRGDIPIILCTGFSELVGEEEASAMGIQGFIMKPVLREDMARALRNALEGKK
jgi:PAS domain S-box-containing protein